MIRWIAVLLLSLTEATLASAGEPAIPKLATNLIAAVHKAALKGEPEKLRPLMAADFTSSFGGDGGIDEALALWGENPVHLQQLAKSTAGRCERVESDEVVCPSEAVIGYRAGFKLAHGRWLFTYFVAGD